MAERKSTKDAVAQGPSAADQPEISYFAWRRRLAVAQSAGVLKRSMARGV